MRKLVLLAVLGLAAGCGGEEGDSKCWGGSSNFDPSDYDGLCVANPDVRMVEYCVELEQVSSAALRDRFEGAQCAERELPTTILLTPYPTLNGDPAGYGPRPQCDPCAFAERELPADEP